MASSSSYWVDGPLTWVKEWGHMWTRNLLWRWSNWSDLIRRRWGVLASAVNKERLKCRSIDYATRIRSEMGNLSSSETWFALNWLKRGSDPLKLVNKDKPWMFLNEDGRDKDVESSSVGSKRAPQGELREGIVISPPRHGASRPSRQDGRSHAGRILPQRGDCLSVQLIASRVRLNT